MPFTSKNLDVFFSSGRNWNKFASRLIGFIFIVSHIISHPIQTVWKSTIPPYTHIVPCKFVKVRNDRQFHVVRENSHVLCIPHSKLSATLTTKKKQKVSEQRLPSFEIVSKKIIIISSVYMRKSSKKKQTHISSLSVSLRETLGGKKNKSGNKLFAIWPRPRLTLHTAQRSPLTCTQKLPACFKLSSRTSQKEFMHTF